MAEHKVYVLIAKSGKTYVGQTGNFENRIKKHNSHSSKATRLEEQWRVVYEESFSTRAMAVKRERFLKTGDGRRVLKNKILGS